MISRDINSDFLPMRPGKSIYQGAVEVYSRCRPSTGKDVKDIDGDMASEIGFQLMVEAHDPIQSFRSCS